MLYLPRCRLVLAASILLNHIHLALAVCTNFTFITNIVEAVDGIANRWTQEVDFVSCPTSLNRPCQIPVGEYNITLPTRLNISSHYGYNDTDIWNNRSLEGWGNWTRDTPYFDYPSEEAASYIFNMLSDVSDTESIFNLVADYWAHPPSGYSLQVVKAPLETTVSTRNISQKQWMFNLTAGKGTNLTLYYKPSMVYTWATFSGCDNKSLDGFPIEVVTPYFYTDLNSSMMALSGQWLTKEVSIYDEVTTSSKKNVGTALDIKAALTSAFMALGVLSLMIL
jgi:hypothetical protein